jgi:hypothetical protein
VRIGPGVVERRRFERAAEGLVRDPRARELAAAVEGLIADTSAGGRCKVADERVLRDKIATSSGRSSPSAPATCLAPPTRGAADRTEWAKGARGWPNLDPNGRKESEFWSAANDTKPPKRPCKPAHSGETGAWIAPRRSGFESP